MAKQKEMTKGQKIILASRGYSPSLYEVLFDYPNSMIIRSIDQRDAAIIFKKPYEGLMVEPEAD